MSIQETSILFNSPVFVFLLFFTPAEASFLPSKTHGNAADGDKSALHMQKNQ